jgi:tetratricopeptide (TPR) repeat protein
MHRLRCLRRVAAVLLMSIGSCWVVAAEAHAQGAPASNPRVRAEGRVSPPAAAPAARPRTEETPASTKANEKAARDAFERGRVFYDAGQFEQASLAFEEAYKLSGRDALLYNLYLAYRDASAQEKAAEALRGYLAKVPNIENRAQLEARLAALEQNLARQHEQQTAVARAPVAPLATPPETAAPAPALPPPTESRTDEPAPRSLRFYAGISLAAVGAAAMLTSIATGVLAKHRQQELEDKCDGRICDASLEDTAASGKRLAHTTDALLFGGIALAGAGAALLVFGGLERPKTQAAQRPRFSAACSFDGCVARSTLRF